MPAERKTWEGKDPRTGEEVKGVRAWTHFILPVEEREELEQCARMKQITFNELCVCAMFVGLQEDLTALRALSTEERAKFLSVPAKSAVDKIDTADKASQVIAKAEKTLAAQQAKINAAKARLAQLQGAVAVADPEDELGDETDEDEFNEDDEE